MTTYPFHDGSAEARDRALAEHGAPDVPETPGRDACVMTHQQPFDFAQCETHDETFPLGERCRFDGRDARQGWAAEQDRRLRIQAREQAATLARIEALCDADPRPTGYVLTSALLAALTPDAATDGEHGVTP